jgi:Arc/MetJ-type ribon-helix-helix transcriptional regulator
MEKQKRQDSRTALRFPHEQREKIDKMVAQGKFKSLSQVVRAALAEFLKNEPREDLCREV